MSGRERARRARVVQHEIASILLQDWDPIGIADTPEAHDEYDGHVGAIYRLLASHATPESVAEHLVTVETEVMGLPRVEPGERLAVAQKLCALAIALGRG